MDRFSNRRRQVWPAVVAAECDGLLVTEPANVTYLTGFTGDDSYLLLVGDRAVMLSDSRFTTQLADECPELECRIRTSSTKMTDFTCEAIKDLRLGRIGFEAGHWTVSTRNALAEKLPAGLILSPTDGLVEKLRQIKDEGELAEIRKAIWYAERAFTVACAMLRPEMTERDVAAELEYQIRKMGGQGCSFEPIVAVGARAALPHARASGQRIDADGLLLIDWGARSGGYCSDLTRVRMTGKVSPKIEEIYGVVQAAQTAAIQAIGPGVEGKAVDAVARDLIKAAGYDAYFGHGLGHGIGLHIHEGPRLSPLSTIKLEPGMIITVEPGIYLPGEGGVRLEDDVLVTATGYEVLSHLSTERSFAELPLTIG